jgi:hypothetical protein
MDENSEKQNQQLSANTESTENTVNTKSSEENLPEASKDPYCQDPKYPQEAIHEKQEGKDSYYWKHREEILAKQKAKREIDLVAFNQKSRAYYAKNKEKILADLKEKRQKKKQEMEAKAVTKCDDAKSSELGTTTPTTQ